MGATNCECGTLLQVVENNFDVCLGLIDVDVQPVFDYYYHSLGQSLIVDNSTGEVICNNDLHLPCDEYKIRFCCPRGIYIY